LYVVKKTENIRFRVFLCTIGSLEFMSIVDVCAFFMVSLGEMISCDTNAQSGTQAILLTPHLFLKSHIIYFTHK